MGFFVKNALMIVIGFSIFSYAHAGEFNVACSYDNENIEECAKIISDVVTDKFTSKFPASRFSIFVHSSVHAYSRGGYVAYAVAGVVPRGSGEFPVRYFSSSAMNGEKRVDGLELSKIELENYRDVVRQLMNKCEIAQACDVYVPRKR
ncbi:MAG: hypothetical protein ACT4NV_12105 [Rhodoferax sp.]